LTDGFKIEPLGPTHDRSAFSAGNLPLDRYFHELATQDIRRRVSNCFVALDDAGSVAAYYTFAATSLPLGDVAPEHGCLPLRRRFGSGFVTVTSTGSLRKRAGRSSRRCNGTLPSRRRFGSEDPKDRSRDEVALKVEVVVDGGMDAEEPLGGSS
jgi:hypothetical protein